MRPTHILLAPTLAVLLACGSDAAGDAVTTTTASEQLCELAEEIFEQDAAPTRDQLERYQQLAPDRIRDAVDAVATPVLALDVGATPDQVALARADDDVERAVEEVRAFEERECDVRHSEDLDETLPEDASRAVEDAATRVDVTATDYAFGEIGELAAGRTSFVLHNAGAAAHQLVVRRPDDEGVWASGLAAPGGGDDEPLTFDLEPGRYEARCLVPTADGRTHADLGMVTAFTVA